MSGHILSVFRVLNLVKEKRKEKERKEKESKVSSKPGKHDVLVIPSSFCVLYGMAKSCC